MFRSIERESNNPNKSLESMSVSHEVEENMPDEVSIVSASKASEQVKPGQKLIFWFFNILEF